MINPPFVTIKEAHEETKLSIRQIQNLLKEGRINGKKIGNLWFVDVDALKEYLNFPKKVGRPKGSKAE